MIVRLSRHEELCLEYVVAELPPVLATIILYFGGHGKGKMEARHFPKIRNHILGLDPPELGRGSKCQKSLKPELRAPSGVLRT